MVLGYQSTCVQCCLLQKHCWSAYLSSRQCYCRFFFSPTISFALSLKQLKVRWVPIFCYTTLCQHDLDCLPSLLCWIDHCFSINIFLGQPFLSKVKFRNSSFWYCRLPEEIHHRRMWSRVSDMHTECYPPVSVSMCLTLVHSQVYPDGGWH